MKAKPAPAINKLLILRSGRIGEIDGIGPEYAKSMPNFAGRSFPVGSRHAPHSSAHRSTHDGTCFTYPHGLAIAHYRVQFCWLWRTAMLQPGFSCQFVKRNEKRCKRAVAPGQKLCWQHSHGLRAKWRSLTRNQTLAFLIAVGSFAATVWFGLSALAPPAFRGRAIHVQSTGDNSPNVVDNRGNVTIQQPPSQEQKTKKTKP